MRHHFSRLSEIHRIRRKLERNGYPRLQMLLLVMITGAVGFLASYLLLHVGLNEMWLRYLVAFGIAYLAFLLLLWLWIRTSAHDYTDFPDLSNLTPSCGDKGHSFAAYSGKGGDFGGGGASGSFEPQIDATHFEVASSSTDSGPVGEALGAVAEADSLAIPLLLLVLVAALLVSSFFVIYSAPVLFAELLVDGVLAASLYRRLRGLETSHWLGTALRRTFLPFLLTAMLVSAAGWGLAIYAPGADSIGDVLLHAKTLNSTGHG
jgi:hypothetical protein